MDGEGGTAREMKVGWGREIPVASLYPRETLLVWMVAVKMDI